MYKARSPGGKLLKDLERPKDGIYLITGHGSDNPGVEKKIPKSCKYCTFAECGLATLSDDPRVIRVEKEFMKGNSMFEKPTSVNKFLHRISKDHVNNINNLLIRGTKNSISIKNYSKTFKKIPKSHTPERARHTYTLTTYSLFAYHYTEYGINEFITDIIGEKDITKNYIKTLSDKLEYIVENSGIIKFTEKPRDSKKYTYKMFDSDDLDVLYDSIKNTGLTNMQYMDIYKLINDMLYRKNRNIDLTPVIKEAFKYSFFPPVDMVLEFYNKMRKTRFNNIFDFKDEFNNKFDITQEDLFHYLPGTYYSFICRTTLNDSKAMLRRQLSPLNPLTRKRPNYRPNYRFFNPLNFNPLNFNPQSTKYKPLILSPSVSPKSLKSQSPNYKPLILSPSVSPKSQKSPNSYRPLILSPSISPKSQKSQSPNYKPLILSPSVSPKSPKSPKSLKKPKKKSLKKIN